MWSTDKESSGLPMRFVFGPSFQIIRERSIALYVKESPLPPNGEPVTAGWVRDHGAPCREVGYPDRPLWALRVPAGTVVMRWWPLPDAPNGPFTTPSEGYAISDGHCTGAVHLEWCGNYLYVL